MRILFVIMQTSTYQYSGGMLLQIRGEHYKIHLDLFVYSYCCWHCSGTLLQLYKCCSQNFWHTRSTG